MIHVHMYVYSCKCSGGQSSTTKGGVFSIMYEGVEVREMAYIIQGVRDSSWQIGQRSQNTWPPQSTMCVRLSTSPFLSPSLYGHTCTKVDFWNLYWHPLHLTIFPLLSLHNEKYICSLASKGFRFVVKRSDPHSLQYTSLALELGICIISFLKSHLVGSHQSTFSLIIVSFGNIPLPYHIFN